MYQMNTLFEKDMFKQIYAQYLDGIENFYRYSKTRTVVLRQVRHSNVFYLELSKTS